MKKIMAGLGALVLGLGIALAGTTAAHATTSDSPTLYTVDADGVTLPSGYLFEASNHVNVKTAPDGTGYPGLHLDPNNGHPGAAFIGQSFIPWGALGVPACSPVGWVQVGHNDPAINNPHYGEGGQPVITTAGCAEEPPVEEPPVETPKKVYVCKYVGTPGVDERLQTGNNPIAVSANAIPGWDGSTIPFPFADAHGKSVVIAPVTDGPEPSVSECPDPEEPPVTEPECITAAWAMPGQWTGGATWPQALVGSEARECGDLTWPVPECGVNLQIDSYYANETTTALLAGGVLHGPNNPPESLWEGSPAWKFVKGADCPPIPDKPEPIVTVETETMTDCEAEEVVTTTTTTTINWVLEGRAWIQTEPVVTVTESERPATLEECPPPVKPLPITETESESETDCEADEVVTTTTTTVTDWILDGRTWVLGEPVVTVTVETVPATDEECPPPVVPPVDPPVESKALAGTGDEPLWGAGALAALLILAGVVAAATRRRA